MKKREKEKEGGRKGIWKEEVEEDANYRHG